MIVKNIFSILAIYALTFGLFFAPIIEVNVGGPNTRYLAMGFFAFFSLLHIFRLGLLTLTSFELSIIFLSIIVFSLSLFNWDALSTPGSYISLVFPKKAWATQKARAQKLTKTYLFSVTSRESASSLSPYAHRCPY